MKIYFCEKCLTFGYGARYRNYYSLCGEEETGLSLDEVYCPDCGGEIAIAEVSESFGAFAESCSDEETAVMAVLLLIAAGRFKAKKWIVEDGKESYSEFRPTVNSLKEDYSEELLFKGLNVLKSLRLDEILACLV